MNTKSHHPARARLPFWADLLLFKISWVALVAFQSQATIPVLLMFAIKIFTWPNIKRAIPIIVITFVTGFTMDAVLISTGVFIFPAPQLAYSIPLIFIPVNFPLWLSLLWLSFALTWPRGFSFISRLHPLAQAALGISAGCIGYFAGFLLGAVNFGLPLMSTMAIVGFMWAGFVPFVSQCNKLITKTQVS